jgi:hypothetical protein
MKIVEIDTFAPQKLGEIGYIGRNASGRERIKPNA